jgi:succinyl-diaminopimelate desuccinylase
MPELGDNAINKVVEWVQRLNAFEFGSVAHPLLGKTTASVTTIFGGQNINSVPDFAGFTIDFRTIPDHLHSDLLRDVQMLLGSEAKIGVITNFRGFATEPDNSEIQPLLEILTKRTGRHPTLAGAPYFTDASALVPGFDNAATVVIGPGEAEQCHQTDEFCFVNRIEEAFNIYNDLIEQMCKIE